MLHNLYRFELRSSRRANPVAQMCRYYKPRFQAQDLPQAAAAFDAVMRERMLPYWYDTTLDPVNGGYKFSDRYRSWQTLLRGAYHRLARLCSGGTLRSPTQSRVKHIIPHTRMLWTFAHAHCYGDATRDYLQAAAHGYSLLTRQMWDAQNGGVYWIVSPSLQPQDSRKFLLAQGYAIYALTEYHRASGLAEPLARACSLFGLVQRKMRDVQNGGWFEHLTADFRPLPFGGVDTPGSILEKIGLKCSNTIMHWMEALSELYQVTHDAQVRAALEEAIYIATTKFYTLDLSARCNLRTPDWQRVAFTGDEGFSTGHDLEFAWLLLRAQRFLDVPLAWQRLEQHLNYALQFAFDQQRGGFFYDASTQPCPVLGNKTWWVQAEGLYALTEMLMAAPAHPATAEYKAAALRLLRWIWNQQMLGDGVWIWSTDAGGNITNCVKAGEWKDAYHETRALCKFIAVFAPQQQRSTTAVPLWSKR
jgi:cellobiose epimerase